MGEADHLSLLQVATPAVSERRVSPCLVQFGAATMTGASSSTPDHDHLAVCTVRRSGDLMPVSESKPYSLLLQYLKRA